MLRSGSPVRSVAFSYCIAAFCADASSPTEILFWHNIRVQKEWLDHGDAELAQIAWAATKDSEEKYDMSSIDARIERVREEYAEWKKNREEWDTEGVELK